MTFVICVLRVVILLSQQDLLLSHAVTTRLLTNSAWRTFDSERSGSRPDVGAALTDGVPPALGFTVPW